MRDAAILAGGRSSRFEGRDKSALVVDGRTILDRQIDALWAVPGLHKVLLVSGRAGHPRATSISDLRPGSGPLGGIHAALVASTADAVFVVGCDMPHVCAPLVEYLFELSRAADLVGPCTEDGYHPLCAVYTRACLEPIIRRLEARQLALVDVASDVRTRVVTADEVETFGDRHRLLANVNTPADYASVQDHKL